MNEMEKVNYQCGKEHAFEQVAIMAEDKIQMFASKKACYDFITFVRGLKLPVSAEFPTMQVWPNNES